MNIEEIQKFLDTKISEANNYVKIAFRHRNPMFGLFLTSNSDYADLKSKNFWRIVPQSQIDAYNKTKDTRLAKIFSGSEFSRLSVYKEAFEV